MINRGTISGVEQVLHLLEHPEAHRKVLADLKAEYEKARALIELAGPASEIPVLLEQARNKVMNANEHLARVTHDLELREDDVRKQAKTLIATAQDEAARIKAEADSRLRQAEEKLAEASVSAQEAERLRAQVEHELLELNRIKEGLVAQTKALHKQEIALGREQERLRAARAQLSQVLG